MDAATVREAAYWGPNIALPEGLAGRVIGAAEFRKLLVSHRRMVRVDRRAEHVRGLQDLDTGELFLTDERRLLESRR